MGLSLVTKCFDKTGSVDRCYSRKLMYAGGVVHGASLVMNAFVPKSAKKQSLAGVI